MLGRWARGVVGLAHAAPCPHFCCAGRPRRAARLAVRAQEGGKQKPEPEREGLLEALEAQAKSRKGVKAAQQELQRQQVAAAQVRAGLRCALRLGWLPAGRVVEVGVLPLALAGRRVLPLLRPRPAEQQTAAEGGVEGGAAAAGGV